jgi:hypothetical protein
MIQCKCCGNSRISDSETICPDCGVVLAAPSPVAAVKGSAPVVAADSATPAVGPSTITQEPSAHGAANVSLPAASSASLTVIRGGALTAEKLTWAGAIVVIGKFDVDEGPVDVDLSQIPEAGYVSRKHCQVWTDASGQCLVKDLGSSNGTFVRARGTTRFQKVVGDQKLADGDELALGNARFVFHHEPSNG